MPTNPFEPPKERYAYPLSTQLIVGAIGIALAIIFGWAVLGSI